MHQGTPGLVHILDHNSSGLSHTGHVGVSSTVQARALISFLKIFLCDLESIPSRSVYYHSRTDYHSFTQKYLLHSVPSTTIHENISIYLLPEA